ncbi:hypothetical protein VC83_08259 [Pseudogymnoascus destructans]|uniref:Uncharacterized protein n=1 Tax=Pseudogymnoascus destructans TaxID=655981 RepID=A0A177A006_9PEZI|nr:uncharacterized protein VC83_08259 [Pseudogymnoascus destructans]OAF55478.1 hypothetical protein VC83_08259 [Pseudogymnoascus destructans]
MPNRDRGSKTDHSDNPPNFDNNAFNTTSPSSPSSYLGRSPPSFRTGFVDPNFDVARIGPYLGPEIEAELQAARDARAWRIEQGVREELAQEPYGGEELAQKAYGGDFLAQQAYGGAYT